MSFENLSIEYILNNLVVYDNNKNIIKTIPNRTRHVVGCTAEKIYMKINNITEVPMCEVCKVNKVKFKNMEEGFRICCSRKCKDKSPTGISNFKKSISKRTEEQHKEKKIKTRRTLLEKYGSETYNNCKKRRETNFKKYGVYEVTQTEEFKEKSKKTKLEKYGYEYWDWDKVRKTNLEKYGVDNFFKLPCVNLAKKERDENNLNHYDRVHIFRLNDIDENGLNSFERASIKQKITNEANGNWITEDKVKDFRDYRKLVWRYTNAQPLHLLENIELRGHANQGKYHLDHKYSIFQGFKDNVPAKIIGNIVNLEMLIGRNNLSKNNKCSLSLEELMQAYESHTKV